MASSRLISGGDDAVETIDGFGGAQNLCERGSAGVGALIGTKADTENQGLFQPVGEAEEILDAGHEIRFLEGDGILADQEKVPEKFFRGLKFYHGDIRVRSRAGEIRDHICASRGDTRKNGSMAVFVGGRDDGEGIFCGKRAV